MAAKVSKLEDRMDVTALPYGINTPAGFLTVFMVMLPIMFTYNPRKIDISPKDWAEKAWMGACAANSVPAPVDFGVVPNSVDAHSLSLTWRLPSTINVTAYRLSLTRARRPSTWNMR